MKKEQVFKSEALTNGWKNIRAEKDKVWWFTTSESYPKRYSLDGEGVPVYWDDQSYPVKEIRECTEDDLCTIVLSDRKRKALVMIQKDLPHVMVQGAFKVELSWEDYTREGLWAVKQRCAFNTLEAVIINPRVKTLQDMGFVKSVANNVCENKDLLKGGGNGPAGEKATKDKGGVKKGKPEEGLLPPDQQRCE